MSKSRGNTVDPDEVLSQYGADTLRLFILFAAPPEDQLEWNSDGLEGAWRFLNRVYQMVEKRYVRGSFSSNVIANSSSGVIARSEATKQSLNRDDTDSTLERERNGAIKKVTQSFEEGYKFNTAISHLMVLANAIDKYPYAQSDEPSRRLLLNGAIETLVLLLAPFAPHVAEEMWQMMGQSEATLARVK